MANDYRKYDFDADMAKMEPLMPKIVKLVGETGASDYKRDFSKESHNIPLCDTTYGADALVSPNYEALANAQKEDKAPETEENTEPEETEKA